MQKLFIYVTIMFITAVSGCSDSNTKTNTNTASEKTADAAGYQPAKPGDSVWVIINHIKPDKRQQFEKFVHEVFWPMASKLNDSVRLTFMQTRVLSPTAPEQDGTYSYI